MENYDPLETVKQLRVWVDRSLSSLRTDTVRKGTAQKRYRVILGIIDQLESLNIPISDDIIFEKEALEEMLSVPSEREKLDSLSQNLSHLAKEINIQLRGERRTSGTKRVKGPAKRLRVRFPDGTIISEGKATETFIRSIQYMGLERVAGLPSIRAQGHSLVSTSNDGLSNTTRELDGHFIETKLSTKDKARYIQRIADALRIDVAVEVID